MLASRRSSPVGPVRRSRLPAPRTRRDGKRRRYVRERYGHRRPDIDHRRHAGLQRGYKGGTQGMWFGDAHSFATHRAGDRAMIEILEFRGERACTVINPTQRIVVEDDDDD